MDDIHRLEAKGLARAKIRSKRRRVQVIRRRTVRGALALFAISWAIIFGQLVTGNDPALSRSSQGGRKLLASTHSTPRRAATSPSQPQVPDNEGTAVSVSPTVSDPAPSPTVTAAPPPDPAPAPAVVAPPLPPPAPVITSAS